MAKMLRQPPELYILGRADEYIAVPGPELVVRCDVRMPVAHGLGRDTGPKPVCTIRMLQSHARIEQRYVDRLSLARTMTLIEREQNANDGVQSRRDIDDGNAVTRASVSLVAVDAHQTTIRLPHRVVAGLATQGAIGAESADRTMYKARKLWRKRGIVQPPAIERARKKIIE